MKTAISIPDRIFNEAESLASRLGISRSQLYAKAVEDYTKQRKTVNITERLNEVYSKDKDALDKELLSMQLHSLEKEKW